MAGKTTKGTQKMKGMAGAGAGTKARDTRGGAMSYGSRYCICPNCGYKAGHERGLPCSSVKCPKCGALMRGEHCA